MPRPASTQPGGCQRLGIGFPALYFTVTTFSTVGYGDITAASEAARLLVTVQMILDLLALGLGIRVFIGAVQLARQARPGPGRPGYRARSAPAARIEDWS